MLEPGSTRWSVLLVACCCWGCSPSDQNVDPAQRYQPAQRIDTDNVTSFGPPLTQLMLPAPPRSGFRVIAPPLDLQPGEEREFCIAWPFPAFKNRVVYAGRIYTTPGLHHSNLISKPVDAMLGKNPYPHCHPGASDPFSNLPEVIPDVLFGNSTQVVGQETLAFPEGMGYFVDPTHEILTDIHYLNASNQVRHVEVAYDFFTMPEEKLVNEVAPFYMQVNRFSIPPHTRQAITSTCDVFGGQVVSLMVHTHKLSEGTHVQVLRDGQPPDEIYRAGAFDSQSVIHLYDPQVELTQLDEVRYACDFNNTTDHEVHYGIGENEMCILFGYLYPVDRQLVGFAPEDGQPCRSVQLGLFRKPRSPG